MNHCIANSLARCCINFRCINFQQRKHFVHQLPGSVSYWTLPIEFNDKGILTCLRNKVKQLFTHLNVIKRVYKGTKVSIGKVIKLRWGYSTLSNLTLQSLQPFHHAEHSNAWIKRNSRKATTRKKVCLKHICISGHHFAVGSIRLW